MLQHRFPLLRQIGHRQRRVAIHGPIDTGDDPPAHIEADAVAATGRLHIGQTHRRPHDRLAATDHFAQANRRAIGFPELLVTEPVEDPCARPDRHSPAASRRRSGPAPPFRPSGCSWWSSASPEWRPDLPCDRARRWPRCTSSQLPGPRRPSCWARAGIVDRDLQIVEHPQQFVAHLRSGCGRWRRCSTSRPRPCR